MLSVVMISAGKQEWKMFTENAIQTLNDFASEEFELIVMDNGGEGRGDFNTDEMIPYAEAVNKTCELVTGDWILILNNDVTFRGNWMRWLYTCPYCGPKLLQVESVNYVEGWCISIQRDLWHLVGGFNEAYKNSWEDVDLAWRLARLGVYPKRITMPVHHIWGATRHRYPEWANKWDHDNRARLLARMRADRHKWRKL